MAPLAPSSSHLPARWIAPGMMAPLAPSSSHQLPPPPPPSPMLHSEHIGQLQTALQSMQMMQSMGAQFGPDAALHLANNALGLVLGMQQQHAHHANQLSRYVAAQCATTTQLVQHMAEQVLPPRPPPPPEVVIEVLSPSKRQAHVAFGSNVCLHACFAFALPCMHLHCICFAHSMHKSIMHKKHAHGIHPCICNAHACMRGSIWMHSL